LGKYIFIWLSVIGISAATRDNQHVRLTFISSKLPLQRRTIQLISQLLFLVFSVFFCYWSLRLTLMHFLMDKSVNSFRFPMFLFTAALPTGFALTSLRLLQGMIEIFKSWPSQPDTNHG
jgi:TRAP-type C4-dicarboxylate transport system permease small subunit